MNALIIGASRGIGLEFARQYRSDGWRVIATARDDAGLARLRELGCEAFALDVTDTASAAGLEWRLEGEQLDVAVINAGVTGPRTAVLETPAESDFDAVMRTNVLGPMRVIPQLAGVLKRGSRLGVISSRMGSMGMRSGTTVWLYRASKAALNSVLKDSALVLGDQGVICVALHPGWVRTDMGGPHADLTPAQSVADMRRTLAQLAPADNGRFLNHDGTALEW